MTEIAEIAKIIGYIGGPYALYRAGRKGIEWAVGFYVNGKIDDLGSEVSSLGTEMTRRFDLMDIRLDDVETDVNDLSETVAGMRDAGAERGERLSRMEGRAEADTA